MVGDGEAETGPLEGSWKGISFLNPRARRSCAADPASERRQDRRAHGARPKAGRGGASLFEGHGYQVIEVEGSDLPGMHHRFAAALADGVRDDHGDPAVGPHRALGRLDAAALAHDHPAQPEGLDRSGGGRRG